ncbi:YggT family protein [Bordetella sp. LUAb4]|uniref:YggT family protein n=1 Tax=Bordetella sp. LUAb4 TaxID=2843195 RepID=UPI001E527ADB|nr:YggT family protein [Bordetella sp. LUAb4]
MFGDISSFLLDTVFTLFGAALIARAWLHAVRMHPFNPVARIIYQVTNWLVLPLRKILPARGLVDWASLLAAWLTALVYLLLTWLLVLGLVMPVSALGPAVLVSFLTVLRWAFNLLVWVTLAQAILSWVNPLAPVMPLLQTLTDPLLEPIRRILPRGGIDFSPLVLVVLGQCAVMVITRISYAIFAL